MTFSDEPGLTPELEGTLFQLDDEYHLAIEGVYSTTEQVEVQLGAFLGPYADGLKSYGLPASYCAGEAG